MQRVLCRPHADDVRAEGTYPREIAVSVRRRRRRPGCLAACELSLSQRAINLLSSSSCFSFGSEIKSGERTNNCTLIGRARRDE